MAWADERSSHTNHIIGRGAEVYVSDFGLARVQAAEVGTTKQDFGPIAVPTPTLFNHPQSPLPHGPASPCMHQWMAPEALKSREYSTATDAFSFGVLLWYMSHSNISINIQQHIKCW